MEGGAPVLGVALVQALLEGQGLAERGLGAGVVVHAGPPCIRQLEPFRITARVVSENASSLR